MTLRRPELELGVPGRPNLQQPVVAAVVQIETRNRLAVAAIEALCQADDRREDAHGTPRLARQIPEALVASLRRRAAVIPGDERDGLDLVGLEPAQVAVADEVIGMPVMALVADVDTDVVQERRVLEPFPFAVGQPMDAPRLLEEREGEPRDLVSVVGPVGAPLGQLDHAPATHVRVAVGLRDFLAVARDVIEHEPFAKRQIAERDLGRVQPAHDGVEQDGAGDGQIRASRIEARHTEASFEIEARQHLARAPELLGGDAPIAERGVGGPALLG